MQMKKKINMKHIAIAQFILIVSLVFPATAFSLGFAPTTIYGYIDGDDKYSIYINVFDKTTMEIVPLEITQKEKFYISTFTKEDDGHELSFEVIINIRGDSMKYMFDSSCWGMHNVNITIPKAGDSLDDTSSFFSKGSDGSRGPVITEFVRDSANEDDPGFEQFKKKYNIQPKEQDKEKSITEPKKIVTESPKSVDAIYAVSKKPFIPAFIILFSISMIIIITKKIRTKKQNQQKGE